jgi:hypothetical protein
MVDRKYPGEPVISVFKDIIYPKHRDSCFLRNIGVYQNTRSHI